MSPASVLHGRIALVTGSGSGIGAATARLLGAQGAVVHGGDLRVEGHASGGESDRAAGGVQSLRLDVREEGDWEAAIGRIGAEHGRLDILVHCAGISAAAPLTDTTLAGWREVMATNLDGAFLAVKHGLRTMREQGGAIVVLGSASGIRPVAGAAAYSTSKAALRMLVQVAAKECRDAGLPIRVNLVSPAGVKTAMWRAMPFFQTLVAQHGSEEAAFTALAGPGGRFAEPEEIAAAVLYLVSDDARQVTGVELPVDGGYVLS
jgi:NAD(P)-dependent dehydrogenase (short-subunit alcohol dehydrogenase family)